MVKAAGPPLLPGSPSLGNTRTNATEQAPPQVPSPAKGRWGASPADKAANLIESALVKPDAEATNALLVALGSNLKAGKSSGKGQEVAAETFRAMNIYLRDNGYDHQGDDEYGRALGGGGQKKVTRTQVSMYQSVKNYYKLPPAKAQAMVELVNTGSRRCP